MGEGLHEPMQLLWVAGGVFVLWLARRLIIRQSARRIARIVEDSFQERHEFQPADPALFPWLSGEFYDRAQRDLESESFRFLANVEDVTTSRVHPDKRTYVRLLLLPDGSTRAAIYQIVVGGPMGRPQQSLQTVELLSELRDGGCVVTTTAAPNRLLNAPAQVVREHAAPESTAREMLASHRRLVELHLRAHPETTRVPVRTYHDALDAWQRGYARMRSHRRSQGGVAQDELRRMAPPKRAALADEVFEEMQRQKKDSPR